MLRGVSDDRNDDDAGEELGHAERLQRRLERAHEDLRLDGRQHRADRQQRHCGAVSHVRRRSLGHPQRVVVGAKGEDEPRGIDREQRLISVNGKPRRYDEQLFWSAPASLSYLPATAAPIGLTAEGLPVGMQIIGAEGHDLTTIEFARLLAAEIGGFVPPPDYR